MSDEEGVRRATEPYVVNIFPDVCLTPVGGTMVPVPYQIYGAFTDVELAESTVRMDGRETVTAQSYIPRVVGNELGVGGGLLSGVNLGTCNAFTYSSTVYARGQQIVRHTSFYWMNCRGPHGTWNTAGITMYFADGAMPNAGIDWNALQAMAAAYKPPDDKGALHQVGGFFKGVFSTAWGTVKGLGEMVYRSSTPVFLYETFTTGGNIYTDIGGGIAAAVKDPGAAWDAITAPVTDAWARGDYGEAVGIVTFSVVETVFGTKGVTKLSKAAKLSKLANTADNAADIGKITNTIDDLAKTENKLDNATTGIKITKGKPKLHDGKQGKHQPGNNNFDPDKNRSELTHPDPQSLLDKHAGTGTRVSDNKEIVDFGDNIGNWKSPDGTTTLPTTRGTIHYDASGNAHIVPAYPNP